MSVNRLFLRTAVVAALRTVKNDTPPTMAGMRVYDSALDPVEYTTQNTELPIIAVYTDDDEGEPMDKNRPFGMLSRTVQLRIDFCIGGWQEFTVDQQKQLGFYMPTTDPELEAQLDMFEWQIRRALFKTTWRPGTQAFLKWVKKIGTINSVVQRNEEGGTKVSGRRLLMSVDIPDDCPPTIGIQGETPCPPDNRKFDLSEFPGAPWLADMLNVMTNDKVSHPILEILGNVQTAAVYLPLLKTISFKVDEVAPAADVNRPEMEGRTKGPDGRVELEGAWKVNT